jgi:hypothetical protein
VSPREQACRGLLDFGVGDHVGWVEQAELEGDTELGAEEGIDLGLGDGAFLDGGLGLVLVGVEELVDASVEAGDDGGLLVGEAFVGGDEELDGASVAGDYIDAPLSADDAFENRIDGHRGAVPGVVGGHDALGAAVEEAHAEGDGVVLPEEAVVELELELVRWSSLLLARKCLSRAADCQYLGSSP